MNSSNNPFGGMDPSNAALLQQLGVDNGRLQAAAQLLEQMRAAGSTDDEKEFNQSGVDESGALRAELKALRRENELLTYQAETLADALGACHCFGTDPDCADCGGDGAPGAFIPGRRNFQTFVFPVLESLRSLRNARSTPNAAAAEESAPTDQTG